MNNELPTQIIAYEYEKTCGNTFIREGIVLLDENNDPICELNEGTIREKRIALLFQAAPDLLKYAEIALEKYVGEESRPHWAWKLQNAVDAARGGQLS